MNSSETIKALKRYLAEKHYERSYDGRKCTTKGSNILPYREHIVDDWFEEPRGKYISVNDPEYQELKPVYPWWIKGKTKEKDKNGKTVDG